MYLKFSEKMRVANMKNNKHALIKPRSLYATRYSYIKVEVLCLKRQELFFIFF